MDTVGKDLQSLIIYAHWLNSAQEYSCFGGSFTLISTNIKRFHICRDNCILESQPNVKRLWPKDGPCQNSLSLSYVKGCPSSINLNKDGSVEENTEINFNHLIASEQNLTKALGII